MSNVETMPSAYITVSKGRKKIKDNTVYLNNGQEFELELFNPTTDNLLVKIWINNKAMSSSGVVLRPGDRVFLERYIDIPKKFLFDTYEVNGSNASVQKAIEKNGLVKVQFYKEDTTVYTNDWPILTVSDNSWNQPVFGTNINDTTFGHNTTTTSVTYSDNTVTLDLTGSIGSQSVSSNNNKYTRSNEPKRRLKSKKKTETGRVEQGSHSEQTFTKVSKKFHSLPMKTVEYQIKPTSTQPKNVVQVLSKYCTGCGKKAKPANKFCSNCGTKL